MIIVDSPSHLWLYFSIASLFRHPGVRRFSPDVMWLISRSSKINLIQRMVRLVACARFFQSQGLLGPTKEMNLCQTIQNTLDLTLGNDNTASKTSFSPCICRFQRIFQLSLARTLLSVVFFGVQQNYDRSMARIVFLTRHCVNKVLLGSPSVQQLPDRQQ